ncbi:MAG: VapC toxin family PIN domain ribonuclease [Burkholderiales bacterium]|nr:VapC toxin family PIN domain ribonuclease [Burkholderiales bacterium]
MLDFNVWVALLDEAHVFHAQALAFIERPGLRIATCALVENGVVRILNLPGYSALGPAGFERVARKLSQICADLDHEFWGDDISLRETGRIAWPRVLGHNQITDIYLLALAVAHRGCLVTLDHRVAIGTVIGASAANLLLL